VDDRPLPHDLSAERAILGAVLIEPDVFDVAAAILTSSQFYRAAHRRIFEAFGRIRQGGMDIDFITLSADLDRAGVLEDVGGRVYLSELVNGVPRAINVEGYATIVRDKARMRDLVAHARQTLYEVLEGHEEADVVLDQAEARLMAIGRDAARGDFVLASDWMAPLYGLIEKAVAERRVVTGVPSGLRDLDRLTRGFQPSDLIMIAARPSVGKTSLALQFALEATKHVFTGFCSLEMSKESVGYRAVAMQANLSAFRLMTGHLQEHELGRVGAAMAYLSERRFAIDDASNQNVSSLCAKVRRLVSVHGAQIVFIDYFQLLHGSGSKENRTQEVREISGRLKALAKDLKIPIVVLSQLTRESAKAAGARPELHHLRDGGDLEQDADIVLIIHRPNKPQDGSGYQPGEIAELILAKQRNGPAQIVIETVWDGPQMRFTDKDVEATTRSPQQERLV
jgi:replicative DNA helicase